MPATNVSPNVDNYYVGKGVVSISLDEGATWRDVGNVPEFEFTPEVDRLDHYSSRTGVRTKDRSIVIEKSGAVRIVMEEWTADNLALILMGSAGASDVDTGAITIDVLAASQIVAAVRFVGMNEVGPRLTLEFPRVDFAPSGSINPISDEWGQIEIEGEVTAVNGVFGTATWTPGAGA